MSKRDYIECKTTDEICHVLGIDSKQAKVIAIKGTAISKLDKIRQKKKMNNTEFSEFLDIPKSRWSGILNHPERVTVDYLLHLLVKCGLAHISHKVLGINASNGLPGGCSQEKSNEGLANPKSNWFFSRTVRWEGVSSV